MLKRIDHIGVVVDDLESGRRFLEGLGFEHVLDTAVPERGSHASFWRCGDVAIELLHMDDPDANRERLKEGSARVEHIAIEVDDLDGTMAELSAKGIEFNGPPFRLAATGGTSVWTKPETSDGYMLQFTQKAR